MAVPQAPALSLTALNRSFRLKRTTDVMFGGKQVLVCGYGEVGEEDGLRPVSR